MALNRDPRPVRTLTIFMLTLAVMGGLATMGGTWKPRLGLDLEGGTRITLSAIDQGDSVNSENLQQAAGIIDRRVNGTGVAEAEVSTQGSRNIIVEIPGASSTQLIEQVSRTAQLRFRLVAASAPGTPEAQQEQEEQSPAPEEGAEGEEGAEESPAPDGGAEESPAPEEEGAEGEESPAPRPAPLGEQAEPTDAATEEGQAPEEGAEESLAPEEELPVDPDAELPVDPGSEEPVDPTSESVEDQLAWAQNPGEDWLTQFSEFTCPDTDSGDGDIAEQVGDRPGEPLITCDEDGNKFLLSRSVIEGTELRDASFGIPQNEAQYAVQLSFRASARDTFGQVTTALNQNGGSFAIVLDGVVLSAPGVNSPILDGNAQITGDFTEEEARALSNSLRFGALPIRFAEPTVEEVGPSLAGNQLAAGIYAGIAGLLIVMIYCLAYYRGLGIVVIASLVISALMTYAAVLILAVAANFTLTLPGIAGLIVGIGITADSFIIYFERIRDEMRDGKSMRVAVELGWQRARLTCLVADSVSFLAAVVLWIFAIGVVRGFAFALGISTLIDILIFFFFTKPLMTLFARFAFFNSGGRWSGLSPSSLGIDEPYVPRRRKKKDAAMAGGGA